MLCGALQEEIPFAHVLPRYPISAQPRHAPTFEEKGEVRLAATHGVIPWIW